VVDTGEYFSFSCVQACDVGVYMVNEKEEGGDLTTTINGSRVRDAAENLGRHGCEKEADVFLPSGGENAISVV
jgi:hypothetical protein